MKTAELVERVNKQILQLMETEGTNWCKPWIDQITEGIGKNYFNKKDTYHGMNVFITAMQCADKGYKHNLWGTYNQWKQNDTPVQRGEKSTQIFLFTPAKSKKTDKKTGEEKEYSYWLYKVINVFNIHQTSCDLPTAKDKQKLPNKAQVIKHVQEFVTNTKAEIKIGGNSAYYIPSKDFIQMPEMKTFKSTQGYYGTLLHELTHWTGNKERLDRFAKERTRETYAKEELVAEIGAAQLCCLLKVTNEPREDHAQYLNHWKQVIKEDEHALQWAFGQASKALEHLYSLQDEGIEQAA